MKFLLLFILTLLFISTNAQNNITYQNDLQGLKAIIEKTTSFKSQMIGKKKNDYNNLYSVLAADTTKELSSYEYFYNLSQLLFPLRDNHIGFYQSSNYDNFKTKGSIDSFINTKEFLDYPSYKINIDSLKSILEKKPVDSLEGVYYYDKYYTIGLFKTSQKEYVGVVLNSIINLWKVGQIALHLYEQEPGIFKAIYGHPLTKAWILEPIEKSRNQSLINSSFYASYSQSVYSKKIVDSDYVNLPKSKSKFELKTLDENIQYLRIQSFQRNSLTSKNSANFFDSIKNKLSFSNIIVDLRNNEGGAAKERRKYVKLLRIAKRKSNLYLLVNNGTLSQAEIFLLKVRKFKNVTVVGQTTKGKLAYGSNYGKTIKLPSRNYQIYPTDMKGRKSYLKYESYGIVPEIQLNNNSDLLTQTINLIGKRK